MYIYTYIHTYIHTYMHTYIYIIYSYLLTTYDCVILRIGIPDTSRQGRSNAGYVSSSNAVCDLVLRMTRHY